jgi:O-antigen ligase
LAARIDPARWYWTLGVAALAAFVGLLAGRDPQLAIAASVGLGFLLLTVADLVVGLTIFTAVSFLELASVASGVGLAKVLGLALAISWIATVATGRGQGRFVWSSSPGLSVMVFALLAWGILSLLWAESTSIALAQMLRYALVALLIPIVFTAVRSAGAVKAVTGAFVAGATVAAAYGLFAPPDASGAQGAVNATAQLNRIAGTVGDPNVLASVLLVGAILAVALAIAQRGSPALRIVLIGCAVLCIAGVVLTFSRGGLLALGVAILATPIVARRRAAALAAGFLVAVCVVAYIGVLAPSDARDRIIARDGGSGRTDIWKIGWRMVEAKPITGIGVGNFQSSSIHYQIEPGAATVRTDLADNPSVAHNSYLEIWAELGLVGLALFLGIVLSALAAAIKANRRFLRDGRSDLAVIAGAVAISLISVLASDFFISEQSSKQLWLLVALCPALWAIAKRGPGATPGTAMRR